MKKNYLPDSLWLLLIVILSLSVISFIPEFSLAGLNFKKVQLLADIREDPKQKTTKNSKPTKQKEIKKKKDRSTCKPGITCLEDFSGGKTMRYFFGSLKSVQRQPIRVAFFGDSFIEGDLLCGSFRDTLQQLFGGRGVGFMPITSDVAQFRTTIQHSFNNWVTYSIVGKKSSYSPLGMAGYCFLPLVDNEVEYKPGKRSKDLGKIRLFFSNPLNASVQYTLNDTLTQSHELPSSEDLMEFQIPERKFQSIKLTFSDIDSLKLYGTSVEDDRGIYVDNFSMRGNSGIGLAFVPDKQFIQFNQFQNYKLILLQYGLNVVSMTDSTNFASYEKNMVKAISRLKNLFPNSSIILLSVSDRAYNQNGKFITHPSIPIMRDTQREIAKKCGIVFWDLYEAMGGENSIVKFVNSTPALASKDYTHLSYWGGKKIAVKLVNSILYERVRYDKKIKKP